MSTGISQSYDKEYQKRYLDLCGLLHQAYMNRYFLERSFAYVREVREKEGAIDTPARRFFAHLQHVVIRDLYLVVWKIYFDKDKKANTIRELNHYVNGKLLLNKSVKLSKEARQAEKDITTYRKQYVAHNDFAPDDGMLDFDVLFSVLDELRDKLNSLYAPELHPMVYEFSDDMLKEIQETVEYSMKRMLYENGNEIVVAERIE